MQEAVFSPDSKLLATCDRPDVDFQHPGQIKIWDVATGEERFTLKAARGRVLGLAFAPDGKTLASGGGMGEQFGDITFWDPATGKQKIALYPHKHWIESMAFSVDGKLLASGGGFQGKGGEVKLWTGR